MSVKELKIFSEVICKEVRQIDIAQPGTTTNNPTCFKVFLVMGSEKHWRQTSAHVLPSEKVVSEPQVRNFTLTAEAKHEEGEPCSHRAKQPQQDLQHHPSCWTKYTQIVCICI